MRNYLLFWVFILVPFFSVGGQVEISPEALRIVINGLDTAKDEHVFCLYWHKQNAITVVDSAWRVIADSSDYNHVWYHPECPRALGTAHWHLVDRGIDDHPSDVDSATLRQYGNPFGVVIARNIRKFPTYYFVYYSLP